MCQRERLLYFGGTKQNLIADFLPLEVTAIALGFRELKLGTAFAFCFPPRAQMNICRAAILLLLLSLAGMSTSMQAQEQPEMKISGGKVMYYVTNKVAIVTNGAKVTYMGGVLTAERAVINDRTGDIQAEGQVRILRDDMAWTGENVTYNFYTRKMETGQFRTGKSPFFAAGQALTSDRSNPTNGTYGISTAHKAYVTTDDIAEPALRVEASSLEIVPGQYFRARNAVLFAGPVPLFYFPFYTQRLDGKGNRFDFTPGYRSRYGAFLLTGYNWSLNDELDGVLHADYRSKRGGAGGADFNLHLNRWGEAKVKYYHLHDLEPDTSNPGYNIPEDRKRASFSYDAEPATNLTIKAQVRYQSDERIIHNFIEGEYRANPQPSTYVELNKHTDDFAVDVYAQPRINEFFENVERLPDVRLTGFRQQLFESPLYYESETSAGYYRKRFAVTNNIVNGANYDGARADTFQQLTLPRTFLGWLNITPRAGWRYTYYGDADGPGATTSEVQRTVFNTGAEVTFKASQTWAGKTNRLLALDGLRHIIEPSANYVYVPTPTHTPGELPQYDTELPSLRLLPLDFPDYNAIDAVDAQNVMRLGLRNRFQTKRDGQVMDFLYWDLYSDWRIDPRTGQDTFSDLFSDIVFRPRNWITLESLTRFNVYDGQFRLSFHNLTLQPNDVWSWSIGHMYVRDDFSATPTALQDGNSFLTSTLFLKMNENWGFRAMHQYEVREQWLQQQSYSLYRDLRSWTAALTLRIREPRNGEPRDYAVAFSFSLKAMPKTSVGEDVVRPSHLLGY
jgi:lipopolysaccharide assembly outer membrane protein LptD (OstA)